MAETRWLDDDEQRTWRAFIAVTRLLDGDLDRQLQRDSGMPHAYYVILAMLSEAPGRTLTMSELACVTHSSASRLSHAVRRLEEQGYITRHAHPTDRRTTLASLTDAGYAALVAAAPGHVAEVRRVLFDALTPEQVRQLGEISRAILTALGKGPLGEPMPHDEG
jgi:DNA-binding MarR family transcriptional regulator